MESELKKELLEIENNDFAPGNKDVFKTAMDMMRHIGSTDSDLRELIYDVFNKWIIKGIFTPSLMREILNKSLDGEHLFYKIGEKDTDSVFTRTFSVLIVPLALYMDQKQAYLTEDEIVNVKNKVISYLKLEEDLRGYVEGKGWAHSTAHGADALDDIAKSIFTGHDDLIEIIAAIKEKMCIEDYTYINEENERMAAAVLSVFERGLLKNEEIAYWINSFGSIKTQGYNRSMHLAVNTKNFLKSMYFKIYNKDGFHKNTDDILNILRIL